MVFTDFFLSSEGFVVDIGSGGFNISPRFIFGYFNERFDSPSEGDTQTCFACLGDGSLSNEALGSEVAACISLCFIDLFFETRKLSEFTADSPLVGEAQSTNNGDHKVYQNEQR